MPYEPLWMEQVHGNKVIEIHESMDEINQAADASYTLVQEKVLAVMVADCIPILLSSSDGMEIAAVHAGWRGLATGVIENAFSNFKDRGGALAWLGPAIGPCHYEVGVEVRDAFSSREQRFFLHGRDDCHWRLDLFELAKFQLAACGIKQVFGGGICTYHQNDRFYSHRREGETGRFAAFIWIRGATA